MRKRLVENKNSIPFYVVTLSREQPDTDQLADQLLPFNKPHAESPEIHAESRFTDLLSMQWLGWAGEKTDREKGFIV